MRIVLILLLIVTMNFAQATSKPLHANIAKISGTDIKQSKITRTPYPEIKKMLHQHKDTLSIEVINTVLNTLECTKDPRQRFNTILTVIDYSLPSNKKRLWVFDLTSKKLLFYTYVSHAIKSGTLFTNAFSNKVNSKASSIGVFNTEESYHGRHGLSMRLQGLEHGFNHNAGRRYIVMHSAWYVNKDFIKKYGRIGRSWGCPAIPAALVEQLIGTIKDQTLFIVYYPSNQWFLKSRFLNCGKITAAHRIKKLTTTSTKEDLESRGDILYVDKNNNQRREENEPILVVTADDYQRIFKTKAPLKRMLRRQIHNTEYIALNQSELKQMDTDPMP